MRQTYPAAIISILLSVVLVMLGARTGECQQAGSPAVDGAAQAVAALSSHGAKIRRKVEGMGVGHKISVIIEDGDDLYGSVSKIDAQTFEIVEVDLKQRVTLKYEEVKKVRSVYGGKNLYGQRKNPRVDYAVAAGLLGMLVAVVLILKGSD